MKTSFINPKLETYLFSLEKATIAKIVRMTQLLEAFGNKLDMPYSKQLGRNFYELRIRGSQEVRIFYCFHQNKAIFVHAFLKKSQKTPAKEIEIALTRIKALTSK
ncbi:MAG: type II toxin-antitoxin system RelE/ParE family toxin [Candidatus Levyibacteriota bacterium]